MPNIRSCHCSKYAEHRAASQRQTATGSCVPGREVDEVQEREKDGSGNVYMTIEELKQQEAERRAGTPRWTLVSMPCA